MKKSTEPTANPEQSGLSAKELEFLSQLSDQQLLWEVHRRFGDTWCGFSSGVRSRDECPICNENVHLTRHHLVPIAKGAGQSLSIRRRFVKLCRPCHELAHSSWGPGDSYDGPQDREIFVKELRKIWAATEGG